MLKPLVLAGEIAVKPGLYLKIVLYAPVWILPLV